MTTENLEEQLQRLTSELVEIEKDLDRESTTFYNISSLLQDWRSIPDMNRFLLGIDSPPAWNDVKRKLERREELKADIENSKGS